MGESSGGMDEVKDDYFFIFFLSKPLEVFVFLGVIPIFFSR